MALQYNIWENLGKLKFWQKTATGTAFMPGDRTPAAAI